MSKLSKEERKILKKQMKSQETLQRHENLACSESPTEFLLVANGGLLNGICREEVYLLFSRCGDVKNVYMKPGKPYCFVEYETTIEAQAAFSTIHGKDLREFEELSKPGLIFYLSFIEEVPADLVSMPTGTLPPGVSVFQDFVSSEEEVELMNSLKWNSSGSPEDEHLKHRRIKHFGYRFDYKTNKIDGENPLDESIPPCCDSILLKLIDTNVVTVFPDQLTVNQYLPGQGIPPHVDSHSSFEDEIIILSLGSQVNMDFRHPDGRHLPVILPARSVAVLSGEGRYVWSHGMTPRASDVVPSSSSSEGKGGLTLIKRGTRTSFTFRKVRRSPCRCDHAALCDSQRRISFDAKQLKITDEMAKQLESQHVHEVYNKIAGHFSSTRHSPWPKVVEFLNGLEKYSVVLDVGCGNGKYLGVRKTDLHVVGCDTSRKLCEINSSLGHEVLAGHVLQLPYKSDSFDAVICIAVIHHLATQERRQLAIREMCRILKPGGRALVYVWAMEQQRNGVKSKYLKKSAEDPEVNVKYVAEDVKLPVHLNGSSFRSQDTLVPWHLRKCQKKDNKDERLDDIDKNCDNEENNGAGDEAVCHRYYHVFSEGELERLCSSAGDVEVVKTFYDQGNWCIEFLINK